MRAGRAIAVASGKAIGAASRVLGLGGGSTLPGRLVRAASPRFVTGMTEKLPGGCILVTGTNGKTTTAALLASMLQRAGMEPVHNRTGANLMAGIASALIRESDLSGRLPFETGLFEVDEAALPAAIDDINPGMVLVNNLFRDQLDRYGELDTLAARMKKAISTLDPSATVVLNADDPLVASIGTGLQQEVLYFGIDTDSYASDSMQHAADSKNCAACNEPLTYEYYLFGHLGRYRCPGCGFERPAAQVAAERISIRGIEGTGVILRYPGGTAELEVPLPGLYNVYNVLAAVACSLAMGVPAQTALSAVEDFRAAFGRVERVRSEDREILMILAKNPAGFNEVIRTLSRLDEPFDCLLALNDNIADGRDVSWIWDVDFEMFRGHLRRVVCSGIRAWDMALRISYAEAGEEQIEVEPDLGKALDMGLGHTGPSETLYVVPTYTAMLSLRKIMARKGLVSPFWRDE